MRRVAIMRPADRMAEAAALAVSLGFEPVCATVIDLKVKHDENAARGLSVLREGGADIVIFSSSTAVKALAELAGNEDWRSWLLRPRIVAIGPVTAEVLKRHGARVDLVPAEYTSAGVSSLLSSEASGRTVLLLRSDHGSEELDGPLRAAGARVIDSPLYSITPGGGNDLDKLIEFATSEGVQYYAFTSAMSARAFLDRFEERCPGRVPELLSRAKVGAIGPPTALALEERGVVVDVIPSEATFPALMMALAGLLGAATRDDLSEPTS